MSPQTKSFIALFVIALAGLAFALAFLDMVNVAPAAIEQKQAVERRKNTSQNANSKTESLNSVDTSEWKTYEDKKIGFNFKYKPDWKVLPPVKKGGFTVIQIDPGAKFYNIEIYVSQKGFYAMDGLPLKNELINGQQAKNVSDLLYGINKSPYYFTFDINKSLSLKPNFNALVHSVKFD